MKVKNTHTLPFVHLRVHSAYSLGVGLSTPRDLCAQAARFGFTALALTDTDGTYGFVEFHRAAREFGIKPIYGANLALDWEGANDDGYTLVLLALDRGGLKNLCAVTSVAATRRLLEQGLDATDLEGRAGGLVCILTPPRSAPERPTTSTVGMRGRALMSHLKALFSDRVFVEIKAVGSGGGSPSDWITAADELDIQPVLTVDVRFAGQKQYRLGAPAKGGAERPEKGGGEPGQGYDDRYRLKTAAEMSVHYSADPDAYTNASMIASLVHPDLLDTLDRPVSTRRAASLFDAGAASRDKLIQTVERLFDQKFTETDNGPSTARGKYREILDQEFESIADDDLAETFLKFHEIITRLRQLNIRLGPATGLRLQSLCAYLMGITCFNPYEVDQNFLPDLNVKSRQYRILDLQIAGDDRPATVTALNKIFDSVGIGYVPTVDHVTPSRALRMAAAGTSIDEEESREVLRIAADHPGVSLKDLCEENRAIGHLYKRSAPVRELITRAAAAEGLPCGFIRSKRTLIVSPRPLREFLGYTINPETGELFFQATRKAFPTESIYRIDIATLTALSVISKAEALVDEPIPSQSDWGKARFDRPEVFRHIGDGDVDGVYLLEASLTQRLAATMDVTSCDELTNFLALMRYRRGDMSFAGRVEAYKTAAEAADSKAESEESGVLFLLNETRGWVLYDDQLREILRVLTGVTGPEAVGLLRRFRAHEPGSLAALRNEFMALTVETELPMEEAKNWFNRILFHVGKTLLRQRILADTLIVGRLLWYKNHHRAAFFTALLNAYRGNEAKLKGYLGIVEAERLLLAPHVNHSGRDYRCENGLIRTPLSRIEGLSEKAIRGILRERRHGKFDNIDDLILRVGKECIDNKEVETLVGGRAVEPGEVESVPIKTPPPRGPVPSPDGVAKTADSPQLGLSLAADTSAGSDASPDPDTAGHLSDDAPGRKVAHAKKDGNKRGSYHVVDSLAEFYPHPTASPVELAGRVRDLHVLETSSGGKTRFFVLFDSKSSVRVFLPVERIGQAEGPWTDGSHVVVRGVVRIRDGKKVCDAMEVIAVEGGAYGDGETTPHESAEGDP